MRPQILFPLFGSVTTLPGIGPKTARLVEKVAGPRLVDLLWHLPSGLIDRRDMPMLAEARPGNVATLKLRVERIQAGSGRRPTRIRCSDPTGTIELVYFNAKGEWLANAFPLKAERIVSGRVEEFGDQLQMVHPDLVGRLDELAEIARVEPVYPLTAGLAPRILAKAVAAAVEAAPELPEWQDPHWLRRREWPGWRQALTAAHAPAGDPDLMPTAPPRLRLAYDELLANQLALALVRRDQRKAAGRPLKATNALRNKVAAALPFELTASQRLAIAEIDAEMAAPTRMLRLLQGDVGSGKTVVALYAMLAAIEAGGQAAMLAPTEILARQHHATLATLLAPAGIEPALLTGREKGEPRARVVAGLAQGSLPMVVGTHALLEEDVAFRDLGLAVVDEQHRFGVHQRMALPAKGDGVDVLVMTATPIPRTLQLTIYGDMEVSKLTEKPPGRTPIDTRVLPAERLDEVVAAVERRLAAGHKAYWVCPLVEDSDIVDLAAATARYDALAARLGDCVGLIHGRMKGAERDRVMAGFAEGGIDLLVATTVIEVGVDVPAATLMVIEHAERFGLAQLHQLRGRIGRGDQPSVCLLLYAPPLGATARARLTTLRETDDGFRIAEEDLRLRGAGEMLGTRQSGLPVFRLADLAEHGDLLAAARDDVELILARDPELGSDRGQALRVLLYLFERDAGVRTLRSG